MRPLSVLILLLVLAGCDFIGGADTLVRGSHNVIGRDDAPELVARNLAELDSVPSVSDEDLLAIYGTIRERALAGDLDAVRVLARLAALQRSAEEEADDDE